MTMTAYVTRAYALPQELIEWCDAMGLRPLPPAHILQLTDGRFVASDLYGGGMLEEMAFESLDDVGMFLAGFTELDDWEMFVDLVEEDRDHPMIGEEWRSGEDADEEDDSSNGCDPCWEHLEEEDLCA